MISVFEQFRKFGYTLQEDDIIAEDAQCTACLKSAIGSSAYTYTMHNDNDDTEAYDLKYLHKTCTEFPMLPKFHPHPLRLELDFVIGEDAACHVCNTPTISSSPLYICCYRDSDDTYWANSDCRNFYLHKSCAELPMQINHYKHNIHPLSLQPCPDGCICNICNRLWKASYACVGCDVDVCVSCASEKRVLHHEGHKEHTLTLMRKEALFRCDACWEEAKDSSYVCTTCDFWIHESCAVSPSIIQAPTYHPHPLTLVYSIPEIYRNFVRFCNICAEQVYRCYWLYYCYKCTYFVHMKCSTSTVSMVNENEADDIDDEPDLLQLPSQELIFDLIVTLFSKFQADFEGEVENSISISTSSSDPHIIEKHWSHKNHPLKKLQFTISENDKDYSDDDKEVLICDGCIQPITVSHPSYYACIECGFFLHSFCATKLPQELPVGASSVHPNHSLFLRKMDRFYSFVKCGVCYHFTNGFYYQCQTCNINIDIRCVFLPPRIKHMSHKHHSLVQRPSSESICSLTRYQIDGLEYACETCSNFQIQISCAILPSRIDHRYDIHPITLRYPPFFYEGVFYCEICEEQVNNQELLYHCSESDHSFHCECFNLDANIKCGGTIKHELHTLVLSCKRTTKKKSMYSCSKCRCYFKSTCFLFECNGCGYLLCCECVTKKTASDKGIHF